MSPLTVSSVIDWPILLDLIVWLIVFGVPFSLIAFLLFAILCYVEQRVAHNR